MQTTRREFLKTTGLSAAGLFLAGTVPGLAQSPTPPLDPFAMVPLGKTGLKVSRLCLGTGVRGGNRQSNHIRMGLENFTKLARGALDRGLSFFDLADLYGTHSYFAEAMRGVPRDKYALTTKIWFSSGGIPEQERLDADVLVKRFLRELRTDRAELVLLHCVTSAKWPTELSRQMELLAGLKQKGLIRAHGVSCHSLEALKAAAREPWVDSIHARINPYGAKMDAPADQVVPVLKEAHAAGKAIIGMKILGEGEFRNDEEKKNTSIRFMRDLGCVDVALVGFEKVEELDDFVTRFRKV